MRSIARLVVIAISLFPVAACQGALHYDPHGWAEDPTQARVVASDVAAFWRAFDLAAGAPLDSAADIYEREYLQAGSVGLRDFVSLRLHSARALARVVASHRRFYGSIRPATLALDTALLADVLRASERRLQTLYPAARFPDVYLVIGNLSAGGTTAAHGILIGTEFRVRDWSTVLAELTPWERATITTPEELPWIIAHELVHAQQRPEVALDATLLGRALVEGGADFLASLITQQPPAGAPYAYGPAHERELWLQFRANLDTHDYRRWLYNGDASGSRPADLGYYIGYRISEAYYERAPDKSRAVRELIAMRDPRGILAASGYGPR